MFTKKLLLKMTCVLTFGLSVSSHAASWMGDSFAVIAPGWSFHSPNPNNEIFSSPSAAFKGTFTKRGGPLISSMIVLKQPLPQKVKNVSSLHDWLNNSYFEGKAETVFATAVAGATDKGQLFVFKQNHDGVLRITFNYAFVKDHEVIILSQETTPETYKEDMKYAVHAMKNVKFIQ